MKRSVDLRLSKSTYTITGSTARQLRLMIHGRGAVRSDGRFPGYTDWAIEWMCETRRAGDRAHPGKVSVLVSASITLPQWLPPPWAPPDLVVAWNEYLAALTLHEQGHVDIALASGETAFAAMSRLDGFASEEGLLAAARRAVEDAVEMGRRLERAYDAATRHGATQGAAFGVG